MSTSHVLIIGGSSGIGKALSSDLVNQGNSVTSLSRRGSPNDPVSGVNYLQADVLDWSLPLPDITGPISGLAYCPGSITLKPFRSLKPDDLLHDYQINLMGAMRCIQHYLPRLLESSNASIVLFSTVAVQTGMPFHASVSAAKGAVEGFGKALAAELAPKVRVNIIAPSLTATPMAEKLTNSEAKLKASEERHPLKRIGQPEEIASLASHLMGTQSSWITGQVIHIDGGLSTLK